MSPKIPQPALILLNKPVGVTSFGALGAVKRFVESRKVGHCGTLDKFASGLLIILVGKATKLVPMFMGMDKVYRAKVEFGYQTDTLDPEGKIQFTAPLPTTEQVEASVATFLGQHVQVPPDFSAVHVNGKRAYQRKRAGEDFTIPGRCVTIESLEILSLSQEVLEFRVCCSKGTYVRSLARDIALKAGSRGTVISLEREAIGAFTLSSAVDPNDLSTGKGYFSGKALQQLVPNSDSIQITIDEQVYVQDGVIPFSLSGRIRDILRDQVCEKFFLLDDTGAIVACLSVGPTGLSFDWVQSGS